MTDLNDFIVLMMMIIVYFLPYFLIFKVIKLSTGALGKIQGALDNASSKVKDNPRLKTLRDNAKSSRDLARKNKNLQTMSDTANINGKGVRSQYARAKRLNARSSLGRLGATGAYADQLQGSEDRDLMKNAEDALNTRLDGLDASQQAVRIQEILRDTSASPQMHRKALARATQLGEVGIIQEYRNNPANYSTFQNAMSNDGLFGSLDQIAPYITRASSTTTASSASQQTAQSLKNFGSLKMGDIRPPGVERNQQQQDTVAELQRMTTSADPNSGAANMEERHFLTAAINQFAQREDLGQLDPANLALFNRVRFSDGRTAAEVIQSGGNLKVITDPATGDTRVVSSDT